MASKINAKNCYIIGKISKDTAAVSLCPMISVTPISGYNSEPQEEFDNFIKEMDDFVAKNCAYPESNCDLSRKVLFHALYCFILKFDKVE